MRKIFLIPALLLIMFISVYVRLASLNAPTVLDFDPFWHYRHAKELIENDMRVPDWDRLSFFPAGRPPEYFQGWFYSIAIFYKILSPFGYDLMKTAMISPLVMVALVPIPAFFLGKTLKNDIAGLLTAIFATLTPTFMSISTAGYCDSDATVVFYSFLTVFFTVIALKKKSFKLSILAILTNLLFIFNWGGGWLTLILFTSFLPAYFIFRILETIIHTRILDFKTPLMELKETLKYFLLIFIATNVLGYFLFGNTVLHSLLGGLSFTAIYGTPPLVNVSVAELQLTSIFTREGFLAVAGRIGMFPFVVSLFFPILIILRVFKKQKIEFENVFLLLWALVMFVLISRGVRFSLLFSIPIATTSSFVIGSVYDYLQNKKRIFLSSFMGIVGLLTFMFIVDAINIGSGFSAMALSPNWYEALDWLKENANEKAMVSTWWDYGHVLTGYTGLRVHADGAHCIAECYPYNHDIRIQNMGRIMSTNNEEEAVALLEKYRGLSEEECREVKEKFNGVPDDACEPASEIYLISSNDLIGKFVWMNYFGGYRAPIDSYESFQLNAGSCCAQTPKSEPNQIPCGQFANEGKGVWVWCIWVYGFESQQGQEGNRVFIYKYAGMPLSLVEKDGRLLPVLNNRFLINNLVVGDYRDNLSNYNTTLERIDGLVWVEQNMRTLVYFPPAIRDSIFTRTFFFDGEGLEHFELVFKNPEVRIFKVI